MAETTFTKEQNVDDGYHLTSPSQMLASQAAYSQTDGLGTTSLPMLTPLNPSQLLRQAQGQISVDDDLPERDPHSKPTLSIEDSPFLHLSNNLSGSTSSRLKLNSRSVDGPSLLDTSRDRSQTSDFNDASQYSYLGLGVTHGSDLVITNTASLLNEEFGGVGLVGLEKGMDSSQSSVGRRRVSGHRLDMDEQLDETPVLLTKEESMEQKRSSSERRETDMTRLNSFEDATDVPVRDNPPAQSPSHVEHQESGLTAAAAAATAATGRPEGRRGSSSELPKRLEKMTSLSLMTSLTELDRETSRFSSREQLVSKDRRDLQETPERHRAETMPENTNPNFRRARGKGTSKLGKLTSLEYIRNSLRKMRRKTSGSKDREMNGQSKRKKHLKPAIKPTSSFPSNPPEASHVMSYQNQYAMGAAPYSSYGDRGGLGQQYPPPTSSYAYSPSNQFIASDPAAAYGMDGYPYQEPYMGATRYPVDLSQGGYPELSPILSVPYDYHMEVPPDMIGLGPPYGLPEAAYLDSFQHPQHQYNGLSPEELSSSYRQAELGGGGQSQRSVRWNLELEEIPRTPVDADELTPTDLG